MAIQRLAADPAHGRSGAVLLQRKLTIGSVDDPLEHEADRVAEHVMRMPAPMGSTDSRALYASRESQVGSPTTSDRAALLQRKCACGGTCDQCNADQTEEHATVQRKPAAGPQIATAGSSAATTAMNAPPMVHEVLRSPGQPLPSSVRTFFEPRFGADFSQVRVHTDGRAAESARAVNALAYTVGREVVFGSGQYAPSTSTGRGLLAHELTHVIQQGALEGGTSNGNSAILQRRLVTEGVGGCGLCNEARFVGTDVHVLIQNGAFPSVRSEFPIGFTELDPDNGDMDGRLDLLEVTIDKDERSIFASIGEIKPNNYRGIKAGERDLQFYDEAVRFHFKSAFPDHAVFVRRLDITPLLPLLPYTETPGCPSQLVEIEDAKDGLYLYNCIPTRRQLAPQARECCNGEEKEEGKEPKDKEPKGQEPKDQELDPSLPLAEKIVILGAKVAALLIADGLLSGALSFVGGLAVALSPLLALAALAVGIVFLWDKIKWVANMIVGAVQWVLDKISSVVATILDTIKEIGIKIGELAVWIGGLIKDLAEKIAEGLLWAGRQIARGAKWVGGKIADAAEAVWDWLFGSDVEPTIPKFEPPITEEPTMHCGTVAREDALIQIDSDLLFPFGEWELTKLTPEGHFALIAAAAKVLLTPRTTDDPIRFLGYTDVIGYPDKNQRLSEQRAGAVADWFVQHGIIPMSMVEITGFGETQAKAKPDDEEGRKKDRRVDILVTKKGSSEQVCW
jgi:outer membrane protein OmpA-like peptidoglycan-associated protein